MNPEGFPRELLSEILTKDLEVTRAQNRNYCFAEGFTRLTRISPTWPIFLRYKLGEGITILVGETRHHGTNVTIQL